MKSFDAIIAVTNERLDVALKQMKDDIKREGRSAKWTITHELNEMIEDYRCTLSVRYLDQFHNAFRRMARLSAHRA